MNTTTGHEPGIGPPEPPERCFSILHPLLLSFFSPDLYRDAGRNWRGASFVYMLLLSLISTVPFLMRAQTGIDTFVDEEAPPIIDQIPDISISGGRAHVDADQPVIIKDPANGKDMFILDTTGTVTSLEDTDALVLLTENRLLLRQNEWSIKSYDVSEWGDHEISRDRLYEWLEIGRNWLAVFLFPFVLVFTYAVGTILALLYGGIGNLFCNVNRTPMEYPALVSLAVMAMTPAWLLGVLFGLFHVEVPFWMWVSFLISMSYLYLGVRAAGTRPEGPDGAIHIA